MAPKPGPSDDSSAAAQVAADWVARRDRGLTGAEQDEYLQWLSSDPSHPGLIVRHEATVRRLQHLANWRPCGSSEPNPDLFARPRRSHWRRAIPWSAIAACVALGLTLAWRETRPAPPRTPAPTFLRVNERQTLSDGSLVELRDGSRIEVLFSATERRVRLMDGEAQFTVAKNPARPFIVEARGVAVRAVGTVFAVRLDAAAVDVLVTEGKVRVEPPAPAGTTPAAATESPIVQANYRAVVSLESTAPAPSVTPVTEEQIKDVLGWQVPRFQFYETPLTDAVAEFNQCNRTQLVIGDAGVGGMRIGGTFRVDNVEGFVSLLQLTLGIRAEPRGGTEIVLLPAR